MPKKDGARPPKMYEVKYSLGGVTSREVLSRTRRVGNFMEQSLALVPASPGDSYVFGGTRRVRSSRGHGSSCDGRNRAKRFGKGYRGSSSSPFPITRARNRCTSISRGTRRCCRSARGWWVVNKIMLACVLSNSNRIESNRIAVSTESNGNHGNVDVFAVVVFARDDDIKVSSGCARRRARWFAPTGLTF